MKIVLACEYSGRTREAFRARGHDVVSVDLLPSEDNSPHHIVGDAFAVIDSFKPDMVIAHPPCTYLANSGVRWLWLPHRGLDYQGNETIPVIDTARWKAMKEGAEFFAKFLRLPVPKIAVENPIMHGYARTEIKRVSGREITQHFVQPWWGGDKAFKATGFTLIGLPSLTKPASALVPPKHGTPEHKAWSVIHNASPGPNRWKERSRTFPGIAKLMAEQWG
jgi:hypothetical protein